MQLRESTIISYNHLNLPTNITITGGKTIDVTNAADGTKLRKVVKTGATINLVQVADPVSNVMSIGNASGRKLKKILSGGTTKSYIGSFEYVGTTVEAVYHSEGRARNNSGTYVYGM
ncbi:MAG: hypothetical protein IPF93_00260 [Saprospiraceae bacterium]|nr:hypothetical protein [Saprospiraceae bacterium]